MTQAEYSRAELGAFLSSCERGDVREVEALLRRLPSLAFASEESEGGGGVTGLWLAAEGGHTAVVEAILKSLHMDGALVERALGQAHGPDHVTPLYVASQNGHAATVEALCGALRTACGAAALREVLNTAKRTGATPLYIAAQQGCLPVLRVLLQNKADVDRATDKGLTPLMIAAYQGHAACVEALLEARADPSIVSSAQGRTALQWAAAFSGDHSADWETREQRYSQVRQLLSQAMQDRDASKERRPPAVPVQPQKPAEAEAAAAATATPLTPEEVVSVNRAWKAFRERIAKEAAAL